MKLRKSTHALIVALSGLSALLLNAPRILADGGAAVSAAPSFDPTQIVLQSGGFGLCVYMVIWLTSTHTKNLSQVTEAITKNTDVLQDLRNTIERIKN